MNIVSGSVWHVLTYALNGIVFVLLGTQLPLAMQDTWENVRITNSTLILLVSGSPSCFWPRDFCGCSSWISCHVRATSGGGSGQAICAARSSPPSAGAKGTITLSIMFSIPTYAVSGRPTCPSPNASC